MRPLHLTSPHQTAVCGNTPADLIDGGEVAFCAAAGQVVADDGQLIEWVQLLPMGVFSARDGRGPWFIKDKAHAAQIVAASKGYAGSTDVGIDYDHQFEAALKDHSIKAVASGWIKEFQVRDDGIFGRVEWTPAAAAHLKAKEYRYISPVFLSEKHDAAGSPARVLGLLRAGLTNNPALPELAAVAAHDPSIKDQGMNLHQKLLKAMGLPDATTEDQVLAACSALTTTAASLKAVATAAGLAEGATAEAICSAVKTAVATGEPDASKYVPIQLFKDLQTQVTTLSTTTLTDKATAAVDTAILAGKLTPAPESRAFWIKNATADLAGFETYIASAPVILPVSNGKPKPKVDPATVGLDAEDKAVAALLGVPEAAFLASKQELAA